MQLLREHLPTETPVHTLGRRQPNWITAVTNEGLLIETEKTRSAGTGPQLIPAWMFEEAWQRLTTRGTVTNAEMVSTKDMSIKRSSAVCAVLAHLPGVSVATSPIVLTYER